MSGVTGHPGVLVGLIPGVAGEVGMIFGMDKIVKCTRVFGVLFQDTSGDVGRLIAQVFIPTAGLTEQRQRIKRGDVLVARILVIQRRHKIGVSLIAFALGSFSVKEIE